MRIATAHIVVEPFTVDIDFLDLRESDGDDAIIAAAYRAAVDAFCEGDVVMNVEDVEVDL